MNSLKKLNILHLCPGLRQTQPPEPRAYLPNWNVQLNLYYSTTMVKVWVTVSSFWGESQMPAIALQYGTFSITVTV